MIQDIPSATALFSIATLGLEEGGRIGVSPLPGRYNTLAEDVRTIADWQAAIVLSLTETAEMEALGCGDLGALLGEKGIGWKHMPIRDWNGLSGDNAKLWPALSKELHGALDRGEAVLAHCRGGHGRSGMIALRLLIERGIEPETALKRLRHVRPGAVEVPQQMTWAMAGRARRTR